MFESNLNKGYKMTFNNGWTISVQWGTNNYCSNQSTKSINNDWVSWKDRGAIYESISAEIAIWRKENGVEVDYRFDSGDTVMGYLTADEVAEWISKVSKW